MPAPRRAPPTAPNSPPYPRPTVSVLPPPPRRASSSPTRYPNTVVAAATYVIVLQSFPSRRSKYTTLSRGMNRVTDPRRKTTPVSPTSAATPRCQGEDAEKRIRTCEPRIAGERSCAAVARPAETASSAAGQAARLDHGHFTFGGSTNAGMDSANALAGIVNLDVNRRCEVRPSD